jgi:hypothetical protein
MKINKPDLNKRTIIRWKIYIDRSRMYIGYIQFFLIGYVFLKDFKDTTWGELIFNHKLISIPLSIILFVILSLILGFIDTHLGFREEEFRNLSKSNPVMMEMMQTLKEIKKKLEDKDDRNVTK